MHSGRDAWPTPGDGEATCPSMRGGQGTGASGRDFSWWLQSLSESQKETPGCLRVGGDVNGRRRQEKVTLEGERTSVLES